jgi:hypothetical protein
MIKTSIFHRKPSWQDFAVSNRSPHRFWTMRDARRCFDGVDHRHSTAPASPESDAGYLLFLPTGAALGYGEMEPAEKHAGSHRARAMAQFVAACIAG